MALQDVSRKLAARENLSASETESVFDLIFTGNLPENDIASLLLALREKGETAEEILGAAQSMRGRMRSLQAPDDAMDIVGTGGDNHGTLNVSTAAAFVVAACGVPVAKHGNRAATSLSGSSDVLRSLGVRLEVDEGILEKCLYDIGLAFLFAPHHHPAMRYVADVRRKLGVRTIFNLLGPLTNPANIKHHLIGVFDRKWMEPMADVLKQLGSENAWLAHGADGLDEIATTGATHVITLNQGLLHYTSLTPEEFGLPRASLADLKGGDSSVNAAALRALLDGKPGAYRDIVVMNAAAALVVAKKTESLAQATRLASDAIDKGAARHKLEELIRVTNEASL